MRRIDKEESNESPFAVAYRKAASSSLPIPIAHQMNNLLGPKQ